AADHELRVSRDLWHWLVGRIREQREREEDESRYEQRLGRHSTLQPLLDPSLSEDPGAERWQWLVAQAAGAVSGGGFEKVVLARSVSLPASAVVDAGAALRRLTETAHEGFVFAFVRGQRCFLGATPERLIRQMDGLVETGALAGSIARGRSDAEDEQLAAELLRDPKNLREHEIVVRAIVTSLRAAGVALDPVSDPAVVRTRAIQHLFTPIRGRSAQALSVLQLVERLHPTPATGGAPRAEALNWLRAHEGIDRGWYAAPVGWVDTSGNGEFAVALRSGVLAPQGATLFAGCGIVADSNPERELAESTAKLVPMLEAVVRREAR
ncbi:MAG: isochorismate synthase, partial [Chloroflexi bacterium]|nr:isochorismate synthase [Chloroflexota bacterium]